MSEKHDQTNGGEGKKTSGELDAAQKASGRDKAESGEEVEADRESEAGEEGSEGARPKASSRRVEVKRSSGKKAAEGAPKKAKDGLTSVAEEEKTGGGGTGEVERDAAGRFVPGRTEPEADEAMEPETGNDTRNKGDGPATMTEADQRKLVNRLLGRANEMAGSKDFKLSAADLIRLIQFQKEMTAKPRKVTVQWVEDEKE